MLFDGNEIYLHLLYPCAVRARLSQSQLKSEIEAYDTHIDAADYGAQPISIDGQEAVWGKVGNWTFVSYQPADNALALIYFGESLPEEIGSSFLTSLNIEVNRTVSPLWPGYCIQSVPVRSPAATAVAISGTSPDIQSDENNNYNQRNPSEQVAEDRLARFEATEERMMSGMESTKARLDEARGRLAEYGADPGPFIQT